MRLVAFTAILVTTMLLAFVAPAFASDHLANAAGAPGAAQRGFVNPVTDNPSGASGAAAAPGTVPGEGNPNAGAMMGTPAVDITLVAARSGGNATPEPPGLTP